MVSALSYVPGSSIRKSVNECCGQRAPIIPPLPSLPDTPIRNHLPIRVINIASDAILSLYYCFASQCHLAV